MRTEVLVKAVVLQKTDATGPNILLTGAQFALYTCTDRTEGHDHGTPGTPGSCWQLVDVEGLYPNPIGADEAVLVLDVSEDLAFVETQAPANYYKPEGYWIVRLVEGVPE